MKLSLVLHVKKILIVILTVWVFGLSMFTPAIAQAPTGGCVNMVPNPLNPNCDPGITITFGGIVRKIVGYFPFLVGVLTFFGGVIAIYRAYTSSDDEFWGALGFGLGKILAVDVALGSLYLILFIAENLTGFDFLSVFGL